MRRDQWGNRGGRLGHMADPDAEEPREPNGPVGSATTDDLAGAVRALLAGGLPATEDACPDLLSNLRSVAARSVIPSESLSRLTALNQLIPRLIAAMHDQAYRDALQVMLGLAPGTRGTSLSARRRQAADRLGYNPDHFRTDIEPKLVRALATAIHEDLLRYKNRGRRATEAYEPTGRTPSFGPEDVTHEEELVSRIWQHVYGLRAELICFARHEGEDGYEAQAEEARQRALTHEANLKELIADYTDTYGEALIRQGETEFAAKGLERLARWGL